MAIADPKTFNLEIHHLANYLKFAQQANYRRMRIMYHLIDSEIMMQSC